MDTTTTTIQWTQDIGLVTSMAAEIAPSNNVTCSRTLEKKVRPQKDQAINCPRCNSTNTKFCYYNNYSLTQPRYFCKTCRRYWTEGGTLRNIPVGGGSRKNRRCSSLSSISTSSSQKLPDLNPNPNLSSLQNPNYKINLGSNQDLNLGFSSIMHDHHNNNYFQGVPPQFLEFPKLDKGNSGIDLFSTSTSTSNTTPVSALDLLRTGISSRGLSAFISPPTPDLNTLYTSNGVQENGAKMMFPFGCLNKQFSAENDHNNSDSKGQENSSSGGYWNDGMLSGGGSW